MYVFLLVIIYKQNTLFWRNLYNTNLPLNKFDVTLLVSLKKIKIYIIFVILSVSLKKTSIVFLSMKLQNIYTNNFNQNFIKISAHNLTH